MSLQATASSIRTVPPSVPESGITLMARPASTRPHTTLTPARGSSRRESTAGSSVTSLASAKVRSSVRWGRLVWPPAAGEPDLEAVGGAGDRALAQTDLADVDGRVAVQAEDPADVVERTEVHQPRGAARA